MSISFFFLVTQKYRLYQIRQTSPFQPGLILLNYIGSFFLILAFATIHVFPNLSGKSILFFNSWTFPDQTFFSLNLTPPVWSHLQFYPKKNNWKRYNDYNKESYLNTFLINPLQKMKSNWNTYQTANVLQLWVTVDHTFYSTYTTNSQKYKVFTTVTIKIEKYYKEEGGGK